MIAISLQVSGRLNSLGPGVKGSPDQPLDLPDHVGYLALFVLAFRNRHRFARWVCRDQPFLVAVRGVLHQLEGKGEDSLRAAVVLFQQALGAAG